MTAFLWTLLVGLALRLIVSVTTLSSVAAGHAMPERTPLGIVLAFYVRAVMFVWLVYLLSRGVVF